jgi:hypothetical protein
VRRSSLALAAALVLLLPARGRAEGDRFWLNLAVPPEGAEISSFVDLVELRGEAGREGRERGPHDIVLAIDASPSAFFAAGADLDEDGVTGEMVARHYRDFESTHFRHWTTDPDDTVFEAELRAARALIDRLDSDRVRLGLVTVSGRPELYAPVGSLEASRAALAEISVPRLRYNTDLARAIDTAVAALALAEARPGAAPRRTLILLSDGRDTVNPPTGERGQGWLAEVAGRALAERVHVLAVGLGPDERQNSELLRELARRTNGRFWALEEPAALADYLPQLSLVGLDSVRIQNLTSGEMGRAVRLFPDGSFDAYLRLSPGENRLRVTARMHDGREIRADRRVFYDKPERPTAEDQARASALLQSLRQRTLETERAAAVRQRGALERDLEIEPEEREPDR